MFKAAKKYNTECRNAGKNEVIFVRTYEAINPDEARTRAYLNCVKEKDRANVEITAVRK